MLQIECAIKNIHLSGCYSHSRCVHLPVACQQRSDVADLGEFLKDECTTMICCNTDLTITIIIIIINYWVIITIAEYQLDMVPLCYEYVEAIACHWDTRQGSNWLVTPALFH